MPNDEPPQGNDSPNPDETQSFSPDSPPENRAVHHHHLTGAVLPEQIGHYKILQPLGEGGMGAVYLAEQSEPVKRFVALKLIKLGMETREVIARFESERQALALMNHANVAGVLDAGATEQGRPYFVMEYVPGEPITTYCDTQELSLPDRLNLFMQVCHAVQHAHQKGIIHRDIKPSNVLVMDQDGKAVPKVIDFGVAKATDQRLAEKSVLTEQGVLIGTPAYMSPEQAKLTTLDIDTRTDVYSLGVLLYELLTGSLPFDPQSLRSAGFEAMLRMILEVEPSKPSTKLSHLLAGKDESGSEAAQKRRLDGRTLTRRLHGDLDWITMKALEKDRTRRYDSASDFAADIQRHLVNEPVLAGPPSVGYRVNKFVRRNRAGVTAAAIVAGVLMAGVAVTTWQAVVATGQRNRAVLAEKEQSRARKAADTARHEAEETSARLQIVAEFQSSMLADTDTEGMGLAIVDGFENRIRTALAEQIEDQDELDELMHEWRQQTLRAGPTTVAIEVLDEFVLTKATKAIDADFADQPLVQAALEQTVANTYEELGLYVSAMPLRQEALRTRRSDLGDLHPDTLISINKMGGLLYAMGKYEEAEPHCRQALDGSRRVLGDDHRDTLISINNVGLILWATGKLEEAEPYYLEALEGNRRVLGDDHPDTLNSINNMGVLLSDMGKLGEAESYYREALQGRRQVLGDDHPDTLRSISNMGHLLRSTGKVEEAKPHYREALEGRRRVLGDDHPSTLTSINSMGALLESLGKLEEAEPYKRAALEGRRRVLGDDHPSTLTSIDSMGALLESKGKTAKAELYYREALEGRRRVLGDDHPDTLVSVNNMGIVLQAMGKLKEAEPYFRKALEGNRRVLGDDHPDTLVSINNMGSVFQELGEFEDAEPYFRRALEGNRRVLGDGHPDTLSAINNMGALLQAMDKLEEAEPYLREALEGCRRVLGDDHPDTLGSIHNLGALLNVVGKHEDALEVLRGGESAARRVLTGPNTRWLGNYLAKLGEAEGTTNRFAQGEATLLEAHQLLGEGFGEGHDRTTGCITRLIALYESWHAAEPDTSHDAAAEEWRVKLQALETTTQPAD